MKAFELFIGYKIVVTAESVDEVRAAGRKLAMQMQIVQAREVRVREAPPENADGKWTIVDGTITRHPVDVGTVGEMLALRAVDEDLVAITDDGGALYIFVDGRKGLPNKVPKDAYMKGQHGGFWVSMEAIAKSMKGEGS